ncbi:hypothetical protein CPB83DRAFT_856911 [Crepidotus variabilis]|uniref:Flavin-containing monooxygenase n=1 Tax=Crepidotus variabilis TaxID=179855 RepID=A0A9P6EDL6_9AGAR|nr:hypothetical protein CPB83DRAFT_856911 [Crepidotus variabilis]
MSAKLKDEGHGRKVHVAIVGAGLAGISTAIALKRKLGFENFTIFERAKAVGGTWRDNTYPGCGSDNAIHWYSLSTELNPNWKNRYGTQPEICKYWDTLWHKHNLESHTVFKTEVVDAQWSQEDQRYTITLEDMMTKERRTIEAEVLVYAIGGFHQPFWPADLPGRENFNGEVFHSARWRHDVDLKSKKVGVIGNGCSAAQFIPAISREASTEVVNFCRTPQWLTPRRDHPYSPLRQWIFANIPLVMRLHRNWLMLTADTNFMIFRKKNVRLVSLAKKQLTEHIKRKAPQEYLEHLIPNYSPGCKRIIIDPGYLKCLNQSNVSLKYDAIETITQGGIKLQKGEEIALDVIIFGTGYQLLDDHIKVRGSQGYTMTDYFRRKGGPMAYLGLCMPGFPNLFSLLGPNVATGHASVIFSEECQINYLLQLIQPVIQGKAKSFEITAQATDEYNDWLQTRLSDSVWTECASYYHSGRDGTSRISATFPGPVTLFWWLTRRPKWDLFHGVDSAAWERDRKVEKVKTWFLFSIGIAVVGVLFKGWL